MTQEPSVRALTSASHHRDSSSTEMVTNDREDHLGAEVMYAATREGVGHPDQGGPLGRPADGCTIPTYDRSAVRPGIAHIGVGNFHRAHQAVYLDEVLDRRPDQHSWGLLGVELVDSAATARRAEALRNQRNLYTHTAFDHQGRHRSRLVGSVIEYVHAPTDPEAVVRRLSDPGVRIVTLTITEGGYHHQRPEHPPGGSSPQIATERGRRPDTFGVLADALRTRRENGFEPFTVLSCDNLPDNGGAARAATVRAAEERDPGLARWIEGNVAFPRSMVDRITPGVDESMRARLNAQTGMRDAVPVFSEAFRQWVVEDQFPSGRPQWEDAGVEMRDDVAAFVAVKGRLLNAGHSMLAYPGLLAGHTHIHQALDDPLLSDLVESFLADDVLPLLTPPAGLSLPAYTRQVRARFSNRDIPDTVLRVAHDGGAKLPAFVRATAEAQLRGRRDLRRLALLVACFRSYVQSIDRYGEPADLEPHLHDTDWTLLRSTDPLEALTASPFDGWGLADDEAFRTAYLQCAATLAGAGLRVAVSEAVADDRHRGSRPAAGRR